MDSMIFALYKAVFDLSWDALRLINAGHSEGVAWFAKITKSLSFGWIVEVGLAVVRFWEYRTTALLGGLRLSVQALVAEISSVLVASWDKFRGYSCERKSQKKSGFNLSAFHDCFLFV